MKDDEQYLTSFEVLEFFGIKNPNVVQWLYERGELPRYVFGPRTFKYKLSECQALRKKVITKGLSLTEKPIKKAAA
jgi:hypothetical protein